MNNAEDRTSMMKWIRSGRNEPFFNTINRVDLTFRRWIEVFPVVVTFHKRREIKFRRDQFSPATAQNHAIRGEFPPFMNNKTQ